MKQINGLEEEMRNYFQKVLDDIQQARCYATYASSEQKLVNASKKLKEMYENRNSTEFKTY